MVAAVTGILSDALEASRRITWPNARWRDDPVGFARDVLVVEFTAQQRQVAEAVLHHPRVACSAGQKIGKSECAAALALWYFCSFPDARVVVTAATFRQVTDIVWKSVRRLHSRARIPIGGVCHELPSSGLKSDDFRELTGFAASTPEAAAGISGARVFYVVDEASGVDDAIFDAIEGNLAAGGDCRLLLISNPTRNYGRFAEAFSDRADAWHTITLSSLESPNVIAGRIVVPGLASHEWVEERRQEWGEESPFFRARVLGLFSRNEQGRVFSMQLIGDAQARHDATPDDGPLSIGLDPAGDGGDGDETAFAVVRGKKLLALRTFRGLRTDDLWEHLRSFLHEYRRPHETPLVCLDAGGAVGEPLATKLAGIRNAARPGHGFALQCIRANGKPRKANMYWRVRDELHASLHAWLLDGGAIPLDAKLERELNAPEWETTDRGLSRVTSKDEIRSRIGRSPDRFDALALAVYPPSSALAAEASGLSIDDEVRLMRGGGGAFDPYEMGHRAGDPYGRFGGGGHVEHDDE